MAHWTLAQKEEEVAGDRGSKEGNSTGFANITHIDGNEKQNLSQDCCVFLQQLSPCDVLNSIPRQSTLFPLPLRAKNPSHPFPPP